MGYGSQMLQERESGSLEMGVEIMKKQMDSIIIWQVKQKGLGNGLDSSGGEVQRIQGQFYICLTGCMVLSHIKLSNTEKAIGIWIPNNWSHGLRWDSLKAKNREKWEAQDERLQMVKTG